MLNFIKIFSLLFIVVLFDSCATGYRSINPKTINYTSKHTDNNVSVEYKHDLLPLKYKKKETNKKVKLIALKVSNNSDTNLVFGKDFKLFYDNGNSIDVIDPEKFQQEIKQGVWPYLFYLFLTPLTITSTDRSDQPVLPVGLFIGPGLAISNIIIAGDSNSRLKKDLLKYKIDGKTIKKGETVYGLIE
jgi:hypothetical protein